jgi:hypothetical protein
MTGNAYRWTSSTTPAYLDNALRGIDDLLVAAS